MTYAKIKSFTGLKAWQEGHRLVLQIYKVTAKFPTKETYSLTDQMRRAAVSITSNIAEGFSRQTYKEKLQFYFMAQGSLTELENQLLVARDVGYVVKDKYFDKLAEQCVLVHKLLSGLIKGARARNSQF